MNDFIKTHSRINNNYSEQREEVDNSDHVSAAFLLAWLYLSSEHFARAAPGNSLTADAVTQTNLDLGWKIIFAWKEKESRTGRHMEQSTSATLSCIHT